MHPKLKSLLARVTLIGGVALTASLIARNGPHDQSIAIRLGSRAITHIDGVVTKVGDTEPTAGFSQDFPGASPRYVRHAFSAPNGTYIVVITFKELDSDIAKGVRTATSATEATAPNPVVGAGDPTTHETSNPAATAAGEHHPIPTETSFQRQVSLAGGELIVSPD